MIGRRFHTLWERLQGKKPHLRRRVFGTAHGRG